MDTPPDAPVAAESRETAESEAPPEKKKESWWETLRFFLFLFIAAITIRSLLFAPFSIPSGSMQPNLMIGDYLFVAKWPYGFSRFSFPFGIANFDGRFFEGLPERGDIVVFRNPGQADEDYIKRVIGLPGDQIEIRNGGVILNGEAVQRERIANFEMTVSPNSECELPPPDQPPNPDVSQITAPDGRTICSIPRFRETLPGGRSYDVLDWNPSACPGQGNCPFPDTYGPVIVPEGQLFVMGDNRDRSADSRVPIEARGVGLLPVDNLIGRATIAFWSTDGSAEWLKPWTWFTAARWERMGKTW